MDVISLSLLGQESNQTNWKIKLYMKNRSNYCEFKITSYPSSYYNSRPHQPVPLTNSTTCCNRCTTTYLHTLHQRHLRPQVSAPKIWLKPHMSEKATKKLYQKNKLKCTHSVEVAFKYIRNETTFLNHLWSWAIAGSRTPVLASVGRINWKKTEIKFHGVSRCEWVCRMWPWQPPWLPHSLLDGHGRYEQCLHSMLHNAKPKRLHGSAPLHSEP